MQRHGKHVPPSFYHTFARDAVHFAESHAQGKLVSVLEGGYSDRALCSAALAHVTGLAVPTGLIQGGGEGKEEEYWKLENLIAVEKVAKRMAAYAAGVGAGTGSANTTPKRRQAELPFWLGVMSKAFAAFEQACGKKDVQPIGAGGTGMGRGRGSASAVASPIGVSAGRVLRDRGAMKSKSVFEGSMPQQTTVGRRGVGSSPMKATPTKARRGESPSKKDSSTKARVSGASASNVPVTPIKREEREEGDVSMDTDTPTHSTKVEHSTSPLKADFQPQPPLRSANPPINIALSAVIPTQPQQQQLSSPSPRPQPTPAPASSFSFITLSTPDSPALTAHPVTLVDAMSPPQHRIIDANTDHLHPQPLDPLGLDYMREHNFHFPNGEEDAEGSPDPLHLDEGRGEWKMPDALSGIDLEHASLKGPLPGQQERNMEEEGGGGQLYPTLPGSHSHQS